MRKGAAGLAVDEGALGGEYQWVWCVNSKEKLTSCKSASFLHRNFFIISSKASTNIIELNGSLDQIIQQNTSIHRLRSAHYEVKIPYPKSASFLEKNHFIISSKASTNITVQNGSLDQSIRQNTSIRKLSSAHYEEKIELRFLIRNWHPSCTENCQKSFHNFEQIINKHIIT